MAFKLLYYLEKKERVLMKQRKVWNQYEDKILKYLRQQKGEAKWSIIAKKMQQEFQISGRTGKQCRQRYHNHLDSSIINTQWTSQEDDILFKLHQQFGNKWSSISQVIKGRSDNCVKNHFYSKLRKSTRKLNKLIEQIFSRQYQPLSTRLVSKIIEINQQKFKTSTKIDEYIIQCSNNLKNKLYLFQSQVDQKMQKQEDILYAKTLLDQITAFSKSIKRTSKPQKKRKKSLEYNQSFLHPIINFVKSPSFGSEYSEKSSESFLMSSGNFSSSFGDADEGDENDQQCYNRSGSGFKGKSHTTDSSKNLVTTRKNTQINFKSIEYQSVSYKIKKTFSSSSSKESRPLTNIKSTISQKQQLVQSEKMKDQQQQIQKMNQMQDQQYNSLNRKERYSPSSSSRSRSQKKEKSFPRNIDEFNEIEERLQSFHFNMDYKAEQEIIWRVFEPKCKEGSGEVRPLEEDLQIEYGQSQDIECKQEQQ